MIYNEGEVLQYIEENDVKFVKLTFCDLDGHLKNISVLSSEIAYILKNGIKITAKKIHGFSIANGADLYLFPDCATMTPLPWRPQQGRVIRLFCYIMYADGRHFEGDSRYILKKAVRTAVEKGYCFRFATSCEFTLFRNDEHGLPTKIPHDFAGYCDVAPDDMGENIRREICLTLEQMNIHPISSHHESGHGQHEIDFSASSAVKAADTFLSFKSAVKSVAHNNGIFASFMPKPDKNDCGNGMHISMSIMKEREFFDAECERKNPVSDDTMYAAAGIMEYIRDFSIFMNSTVNSYNRLGEFTAPRFITWSHKDISQLIRITDGELPITLRAPDCACNPYFVFALMIYASIEGIENKLEISEEIHEDILNTDKYDVLPSNLMEAAECAEKSEFLKKHIPENAISFIISDRMAEWQEYCNSDNREEFEKTRYFYSI